MPIGTGNDGYDEDWEMLMQERGRQEEWQSTRKSRERREMVLDVAKEMLCIAVVSASLAGWWQLLKRLDSAPAERAEKEQPEGRADGAKPKIKVEEKADGKSGAQTENTTTPAGKLKAPATSLELMRPPKAFRAPVLPREIRPLERNYAARRMG